MGKCCKEHKPMDKARVFGVGLSRTGTSSLTKALSVLGWKAVHWPLSIKEICAAEAATDITVSVRFRELDQSFPGSKFVLTVRAVGSWMESLRSYFDLAHARYVKRSLYPAQWDFVADAERKLYGKLLGFSKFTDEQLFDAYNNHERAVRRYFTTRPAQLLVFDVSEGWSPLCRFLGVPIPAERFPHWNRVEDKPR